MSDPRFLPSSALIQYQVGSDITDIDRTYSTASQQISYPTYFDLISRGWTSLHIAPAPENASSVPPSFKDNLTSPRANIENFDNSDPYYRTAKTRTANGISFLTS